MSDLMFVGLGAALFAGTWLLLDAVDRLGGFVNSALDAAGRPSTEAHR